MMVGKDGKPGQLDRMADDLVSSNPNLRGSQAAKFKIETVDASKRALIQAGALGIADQAADPVAAVRAYAAHFPTLISAQDADAIAKAARTQQHVNAMETREADAQQKRQSEQAVHVGANKNFQDNVNFDPTTGITTVKPEFYQRTLDLVKQNPNAPNAQRRPRPISIGGNHSSATTRRLPTRQHSDRLYDGMFRADKPTTEIDILKAETEHKINSQDANNLLRLHGALQDKTLKGPIDRQDTTKAVHADLTGQLINVPGAHDAVGEAAYAGFLQSFIPKYLEMERAGTLPSNALDINNPKSMLSELMAPFKRSPAQKMQQLMDQFGGGQSLLTQPQQPAAAPEHIVPPSLRGIASLDHNKDWTRFRDQATNKLYDATGNEIKP